jgi:23S rRNA pseudouridine2605 synthase
VTNILGLFKRRSPKNDASATSRPKRSNPKRSIEAHEANDLLGQQKSERKAGEVCMVSRAVVQALTMVLGFASLRRCFSSRVLRIERILANRGVGSRSEVSALIHSGHVSVNGRVIRSGADKFPADVRVDVGGKVSEALQELVGLFKPLGMLTTFRDPYKRRGLEDALGLPDIGPVLEGYHPVGRLDADSTGLLLFSRDGELTKRLLDPAFQIEREYEAVVTGSVDHASLRDKLSKGVATALGDVRADLVDSTALPPAVAESFAASLLKEHQLAQCAKSDIVALSARDQEFPSKKGLSIVRVVVREGKHRIVRRVLHNAGHTVLALHRRRYGPLVLHPGGCGSAVDADWKSDALRRLQLGSWPLQWPRRRDAQLAPLVTESSEFNTDETSLQLQCDVSKGATLHQWVQQLLRSPSPSVRAPVAAAVNPQVAKLAAHVSPSLKEKLTSQPFQRETSLVSQRGGPQSGLQMEQKLLKLFSSKNPDRSAAPKPHDPQ